MRAVVQRVSRASVTVDDRVVGAIEGPGLLVLVGVTHDDTQTEARRLAAKLWGLRVLDRPAAAADAAAATASTDATDGAGLAEGPAEVSCSDVGAPLLVISQFTLYGDTRKGRRPSWIDAAPGPVAEPLVDAVIAELRRLGAKVETGVFGADMQVSLVNDGPITVVLEI